MNALVLQLNDGDLPSALNDPLEFDVTNELLKEADPELLQVADGVLTFHLSGGDRRYRVTRKTAQDHWHVEKIEKE